LWKKIEKSGKARKKRAFLVSGRPPKILPSSKVVGGKRRKEKALESKRTSKPASKHPFFLLCNLL
jgi:hypothetical protein